MALMYGSVVAQVSSTTIPRFTCSPYACARSVRGRIPQLMPTRSLSPTVPSFSRTPSTCVAPMSDSVSAFKSTRMPSFSMHERNAAPPA